MRIKKFTLCLLTSALLLGSCSTPKNINYFQDVYTETIIDPSRQMDIKVRPEDKLSIIVTTQDPALSQLFNLTSQSGAGTTGGQTACYTVDPVGDIDFPVLGKIHISGMDRHEVAESITISFLLCAHPKV